MRIWIHSHKQSRIEAHGTSAVAADFVAVAFTVVAFMAAVFMGEEAVLRAVAGGMGAAGFALAGMVVANAGTLVEDIGMGAGGMQAGAIGVVEYGIRRRPGSLPEPSWEQRRQPLQQLAPKILRAIALRDIGPMIRQAALILVMTA